MDQSQGLSITKAKALETPSLRTERSGFRVLEGFRVPEGPGRIQDIRVLEGPGRILYSIHHILPYLIKATSSLQQP